jgi:hypothetical protein
MKVRIITEAGNVVGYPHPFVLFAKGWGLFCRSHRTAGWDEKNYPSPPINLISLSDFQEQGPPGVPQRLAAVARPGLRDLG